MKSERTRWAVVGLGNVVTNRFAPALAKCARSALVACMSRDPAGARAFAAKFGVARVHATFDDVVADPGIDAVYIATPNTLHYAQTRQALDAGKHVLCEKPLALTVAHGRELRRLAAERKRVLGVAYQFRFESVFERIRELVRAGAVGEPRAVALTGASPAVRAATWRENPEEGGILSDLAVHLLDLVPWLAGVEYTDVAARAHPADMQQASVQTISVLGTLAGGGHAFVRASRELAYGRQEVAIEGTHGTIVCPAWRNVPEYELALIGTAGRRTETLAPAPMFEREIDAFEDELAGRRTALANAGDGIRVIELANAVRQSVQTGCVVRLEPAVAVPSAAMSGGAS